MSVRVLLVDDVADVRRLVRIALRYHGGFEVVGEARAGLQAVELATELQPDIVLLDLNLPDLAGREVLTRVRAVAPHARIVVFTGADSEDRAYYEQHTAGYVLKDSELGYLVGLLEDVARPGDLQASMAFGRYVESVPEARAFARRTLQGWGVGAVDEALLVVTELASNAVLHADSSYDVRLSRSTAGVLRIEVSDDDPGTPEPQPFSSTSEGGRGVVLISALATSWGIDTEGRAGKVTWAELAID